MPTSESPVNTPPDLSTFMRFVPERVSELEMERLPAVLPAGEMVPADVTVTGAVIEPAPASVPEYTVTPLPPMVPLRLIVPLLMTVEPRYVPAPLRFNGAAPTLTKPPDPLMEPDMVSAGPEPA